MEFDAELWFANNLEQYILKQCGMLVQSQYDDMLKQLVKWASAEHEVSEDAHS